MTEALYTLVKHSAPLSLPKERLANDVEEASCNVREEIVSIYQSFSELYPNPKIAEEYAERDRLLEEIALERRQEDEAAASLDKDSLTTPPKKTGFFGFLWGRKSSAVQKQKKSEISAKDLDQDEVLVYNGYMEDDNRDGQQEEALLCGTVSALATHCIPEEAYSTVRFHLSSTCRYRHRPQVVCGSSQESLSTLVIVGLGVLAEFPFVENGNPENTNKSTPVITQTSDREDLLHYQKSSVAETHPSYYDKSYTRATRLGNDWVAISWGFHEGIVVLYRRVVDSHEQTEWESVAMLTPTRAVVENIQNDVFAHDQQGGIISSSLLVVTDLSPLTVPTPDGQNTVTTLAVARLGGFLELFPLPTELLAASARTTRRHQSRRHKRRSHYSAGVVPNLTDTAQGVAALTTSEHHVDIQCLVSFRTPVGSETEWDMQAFPDSPPAEYILAASGTREGQEVVSFWAVTSLFQHPSESNHGEEVPLFSLHVSFLDALPLGRKAADFSVFCNESTVQHWRKARRVQRREVQSPPQEWNNGQSVPTLMSISVSAPIMCMRFTPSSVEEEDDEQKAQNGTYLGVLDANGTCSVIECNPVVHLAVQNISRDTLEEPSGLSCVLYQYNGLKRRKRAFGGERKQDHVQDIGWLSIQADSNSRKNGQYAMLCLTASGQFQILCGEGRKWNHSTLFERSSRGLSIISHGGSGAASVVEYKHTKHGERCLGLLGLQTSNTEDIIQNLIRARKYVEAIELAQTATREDSDLFRDLVDTCRKRIWENERSVRYLLSVTDDSYVVAEVLKLFDKEVDETGNLDIHDVIEACRNALKRTSEARLVSALKLGGLEGTATVKKKVADAYLRSSTFLVLCQLYRTQSTLLQFRENFLKLSLTDLAFSLASMGDIPALSLLMLRHSQELFQWRLKVLSHIPLALNTNLYCHLLPVVKRKGSSDQFLPALEEDFQSWSLMGDFIKEKLDLDPFLDDFDQSFVCSRLLNSKEAPSETEEPNFDRWALDRVAQTEQATGSLTLVAVFCDHALRCLSPIDQDTSHATQKLQFTHRVVSHLSEVFSDYARSEPGELTLDHAFETFNMSDLSGMGPADILSLFLRNASGPSVFERFTTYVKPLMDAYPVSSVAEEETPFSVSDRAIASFCVGRLKTCKGGDSSSERLSIQGVQDDLSVCLTFANASRSSLEKSRRAIKQRHALVRFAIDVAKQCSQLCDGLSFLPSDCRHLIDCLWKIYECLPSQCLAGERHDTRVSKLYDEADLFYRSLVAVDILSAWTPGDAIAYLGQLMNGGDVICSGQSVVSRICTAFCREIGFGGRPGSDKEKPRLMKELLSDLCLLNEVAFQNSLKLAPLLSDGLVKILLQEGHFDLVGELATSHESLIDMEETQRAVLAYVNESMFMDSARSPSGGNKLEAAIRCQDILSPLFPALQSKFHSMRRYLDAAHFANTVGEGGRFTIHPTEIRDKSPLDVIESLLIAFPPVVIDGCRDWSQASFALKANKAICEHFSQNALSRFDETMRETPPQNLPPLPGGAVYHLATILGMDMDKALVVIKSRVVHYAIAAGFHGAAAAVCLSMIFEQGHAWETDADTALRLTSVAEILSVDTYDDFSMKEHLCLGALTRFKGELGALDYSPFETVLRLFPAIKSHTSLTRPSDVFVDPSAASLGTTQAPEEAPLSAGSADFFVFRAAGMVAKTVSEHVASHPPRHQKPLEKHGGVSMMLNPVAAVYQTVLSQYSTNLHILFSILQSKSANGEDDDALLLSLGRLIMFWCISDAVRARDGPLLFGIERAVVKDFIGLAASLLLQMEDEDGLHSTVNEIQGILETEVTAAMDRLSSAFHPNIVLPDPQLVKRLVGRGYSENGARRAAVMSGNQSFEKAVVWAVSHSLDPGFDDPMIFIRSEDGSLGTSRLDQAVLHYFHGTLAVMRDWSTQGRTQLSHTKTEPLIAPSSRAVQQRPQPLKMSPRVPPIPIPNTGVLKSAVAKPRPPPPAAAPKLVARETVASKPKPPPPTAVQPKPVVRETVVSKPKSRPPAAVPKPVAKMTPLAVLDKQTAAAPQHSEAPAPKLKIPPLQTRVGSDATRSMNRIPPTSVSPRLALALSSSPLSGSSPRSASSPVSASSPERRALRQQGEAARRQQSKSTSTVVDDQERKRLIQEGKRLLAEARASKRASAPPPPAAASSRTPALSSRYPLRSRMRQDPPKDDRPVTVQQATAPAEPAEEKEESSGGDDGWDFDDF